MRSPMTYPVILLAATCAMFTSLSARQAPAPDLTRAEGIRLMRAINTAEAQIRGAGTTYGSLDQVVTLRGFSAGPAGDPTREDSDAALVRSHRITLLRSQDGLRYQVSIVPMSGMGLAFFSDQNGVIFVGEVLR